MKFQLQKDIDKFKFYSEKYSKFEGVVELKKIHPKRSINQNSYLHVCISIFAIEKGYTQKEMKKLLKEQCSFMQYEKNGHIFLKDSSDLNSKELTDWIEWIRNKAAMEEIYISTPDEYFRDWVEIEKSIELNKQYL